MFQRRERRVGQDVGVQDVGVRGGGAGAQGRAGGFDCCTRCLGGERAAEMCDGQNARGRAQHGIDRRWAWPRSAFNNSRRHERRRRFPAWRGVWAGPWLGHFTPARLLWWAAWQYSGGWNRLARRQLMVRERALHCRRAGWPDRVTAATAPAGGKPKALRSAAGPGSVQHVKRRASSHLMPPGLPPQVRVAEMV